jgi:hypothetical protein
VIEGVTCTTLVTRPRSRRSSAWRRRDGKSTCKVTRRERCAALRAFRGLLLALFGRPDSSGTAVCGRELNMEVSKSRGEVRVDLEGGFGMVHEPRMPAQRIRMTGLRSVKQVDTWISLCDTQICTSTDPANVVSLCLTR